MEVIILSDSESVFQEAARRIIDRVARKPDAVLGLATGRTMLGVYSELVRAYRAGEARFSRVTTFNLDEYLGLLPQDPRTFRSYMQTNFFESVDIEEKRIHIPDSQPDDVTAECDRYEALIRERGGIDIQLLGIGRDGHIGFNEPSSSLRARTRVKTLTEETLRDNFDREPGPRFAVTMGIGTILDAREIILLATGEHKSEPLSLAVEGPLTASCPASALQLHPCAKVICDREAAGKLKRRNYYEWVWRHKHEVENLSRRLPKRKA